ncbi:hypothetical protein C2R22_19230 [Salinigranum rubrum]|uniref:Spondin domain-containing protein n=1 Tax=Salinigranum rubrum TaxID=755307 RepID=A0A2I8VQ96_9EURY|nr:spondin domain-containing protein [Salinigranum rubrum]AUV84066.1 hypothetical protein C2R22_19230 [Salinigranum rubrum]
MTDNPLDTTNRRRFLQLGGGVLAVGLAGCTGQGGSGAETDDAETTDGSMEGEMTDESMTDSAMTEEAMDDGMTDSEMTEGSMDDEMTDSEMTDESMDGSMAQRFRVRIENVSTGSTLQTMDGATAVPLSPGAYVVHAESGALFEEGEAANEGLERLAEDGTPGTLAASFEEREMGMVHGGAFDTPVGASSPGPLTPGDAYEFEFEGGADARLSFATMFVESNDLFFAPDPTGIALFSDGDPVSGDVTDRVALWDAGTEVNEEPGAGPHQAPRQSGPDTGEAENGTVRLVSDVDDGFAYPGVADVLSVTVTPARMG